MLVNLGVWHRSSQEIHNQVYVGLKKSDLPEFSAIGDRDWFPDVVGYWEVGRRSELRPSEVASSASSVWSSSDGPISSFAESAGTPSRKTSLVAQHIANRLEDVGDNFNNIRKPCSLCAKRVRSNWLKTTACARCAKHNDSLSEWNRLVEECLRGEVGSARLPHGVGRGRLSSSSSRCGESQLVFVTVW